jgi:hypothetical protein
MTPEIKVFVLAAAVIAFAYVAIYPQVRTKTLNRMMMLDLALSAALLLVVGAVYFGSGVSFSLVIFALPWWAFTLISAALVEVPFFIWFCKKWDIDLNPPMD